MLEELHISNLAVIEDTTLVFDSPYVALVGETGAGKSLIVSSLNLICGTRADYSLVRDPCKKASVSALFHFDDGFIKKHPELIEILEENTLIVRRVLFPDHTTRSYLNDTPVTQQQLLEVVRHLVDIHSQNSNNDLLDESKQLSYVISFLSKEGRNAKKIFDQDYAKYQEIKKGREDFLASFQGIDRDYLSFQIQEIEKYHLKENEIEDLNTEYESLKGYARLESSFQDFESEIQSEEKPLNELLMSALRFLRPFRESQLKEEAGALEDSVNDCQEKLSAFEDAFRSLDFDPGRIDEINSRLYSLKGLQRKYGKTTKEILDAYRSYQEKLAFIDGFEEKKNEWEKKKENAYKKALSSAESYSVYLKEAGKELEKKIGKEMKDLGLRENGFEVSFRKKDNLSEKGIYDVRFDVALNEGIAPQSLKKAASGGETSRLMLALKSVLNTVDPYALLVFDEIDTGVSGKQASLIARKIKALSSVSQVLVISHLPQVVASAQSAIWIEKKKENYSISTKAKNLNEKDLVEVIAKMLSASNVSKAALEQAKELRNEFYNHG